VANCGMCMAIYGHRPGMSAPLSVPWLLPETDEAASPHRGCRRQDSAKIAGCDTRPGPEVNLGRR